MVGLVLPPLWRGVESLETETGAMAESPALPARLPTTDADALLWQLALLRLPVLSTRLGASAVVVKASGTMA